VTGWFSPITHIEYDGVTDIEVPTTCNTTPHSLYDLQGRQLREVPQKGVYIQDGKKYIAK